MTTTACPVVFYDRNNLPENVKPYLEVAKILDGNADDLSESELAIAWEYVRYLEVTKQKGSPNDLRNYANSRYQDKLDKVSTWLAKDTFEHLLFEELEKNLPENLAAVYNNGFSFENINGSYRAIVVDDKGLGQITQEYSPKDIVSWFGFAGCDNAQAAWLLSRLAYNSETKMFSFPSVTLPDGYPEEFPASVFFNRFSSRFMQRGVQVLPVPLNNAVGQKIPLKKNFTANQITPEGETLSGQPLFPTERNGVTVVTMWGTWCPPCIEERKTELLDLATKYQNNPNVHFVNLALEDEGSEDKYSQFIKEHPVPGAHEYFVYEISPLQVFLRQKGFPQIVVIDSDGTILYTEGDMSEVDRAIELGLSE